MRTVFYRGAVYREAGVANTIARKLLAPLWKWIARLGISDEDVLSAFTWVFDKLGLRKKALKSPFKFENFPEAFRLQLLKLAADVQKEYKLLGETVDDADILMALGEELVKPAPGFVKKVNSLNQSFTIEVGSVRVGPPPAPGTSLKQQISPSLDVVMPQRTTRAPYSEKPIVRGEKFRGAVFISIWWATENPENTADISLRGYIESHTGAIFWHAIGQGKYPKQTQFGGFVLVPRMEATSVGRDLCTLAKDAVTEGNNPKMFPVSTLWKYYKLGAISLDGAVDGREITAQKDGIKLGVGGMSCGDSIKFNHYITLPDILMNRSEEFRSNATGAYKTLMDELNTYSNRTTD